MKVIKIFSREGLQLDGFHKSVAKAYSDLDVLFILPDGLGLNG